MKKTWRHFNGRNVRMPNPHNPKHWVVQPKSGQPKAQDAPSGENVVAQEEVQAIADAAPAVIEP